MGEITAAQSYIFWSKAQENLQTASLAHQQGWYNASVSRSYYAVFQAMHCIAGMPTRKRGWEHGGLRTTFIEAIWHPDWSHETRVLSRSIIALYDDRCDADYKLRRLSQEASEASLNAAAAVLFFIAQTLGLIPPEENPS